MTEDEVKSLIRDYIVENLDIRIHVNKYGSYGEGPNVGIEVYLGDELVSSDSSSLPEPKLSY